jgi:hypothetical protein
MSREIRATGLERLGLTVAQVLARADTPTARSSARGHARQLLAITMVNDVRRSLWPDLSVPVARGWMEIIEISQNDGLLILKSKGSPTPVADCGPDPKRSVRRYAHHTVGFDGAQSFMFLSQLPQGIHDDLFQPSMGTAVVLSVNCCERERLSLRASLMDCNVGTRDADIGGLIFNATEV